MIIINEKSMKCYAIKRKNRSEKRKKNEEQLREKSLILKLAQQVTNFVFYKMK